MTSQHVAWWGGSANHMRRPYQQDVPPRVRRIILMAALTHMVLPRSIIDHTRKPRADAARRAAMAQVRAEIIIGGKPASYPLIGRWFNRDHTTVLHNCQRHARTHNQRAA